MIGHDLGSRPANDGGTHGPEDLPMNDGTARRDHGSLLVVTGCMFSGKSEYLVRLAEAAGEQGWAVAAYKHCSDNRYCPRAVMTHAGRRFDATAVPDASRLPALAQHADVVVIDEAQFFDVDLVEACCNLVSQGKEVVVAGLDLDSWGLPFGPMADLIKAANRVVRLQGVCARCGKPADHTQRLAPVSGREMVGGAECYEPRCSACFRAPPIEMRC